MHQTYTMWLPREGTEALDSKSYWRPVLTVNVQTDYVDLNKPLEQVAPFFWYSSFLWEENYSHIQSTASFPHRTAFGITTRRKTKLHLRVC